MDEEEIKIPEFMRSKEYEEARKRRLAEQREIAEYERQLASQRQYRLYRDQKMKEARELRKRAVKQAAKIIVCGTLIIVCGTGIINHFAKQVGGEERPIEIIEILEETENNDLENSYLVEGNVANEIPLPPIAPREYDFSFENRLASINEETYFGVGSAINTYSLNLITKSPAYQHFIRYGEMYGVDPYLLMAIALQESSFRHNSCLPGGTNYNGAGVGIMQHEHPDGRELVAYNYTTGENDTIRITMENASNLENNIRMGAMYFQKCLENANGNILIAIQSYNFGHGMINVAVRDYANSIGSTSDAVKGNASDMGWLEFVRDIHLNPNNYLSSWNYSRYGDANYISNVLRYFIGNSTHYNYGGTQCVFDFDSNELMELDNTTAIIR